MIQVSAPWWVRLAKGLSWLPSRRDWFLPTGGYSWVLSLWWAGPCQGVCLVGSCRLRKTLGSLSSKGQGCVPTLLVFWPEASQHWSLQGVGWGRVLVRKSRPPGGLTPMSTPQNLHCQRLCPHSEPQPPPASTGDPSTSAGRSGPGPYEVTAFPPGSWCARDLVCILQE